MGSAAARKRRGARALLLASVVSIVLMAAVMLPVVASARVMADGVRPADAGGPYTITPISSGPGWISPSTPQTVAYLGSCQFVLGANSGYHSVVMIDGVNYGDRDSFLFTNVTRDSTISVTFVKDQFTIQPTAGPGGSISPSSTVTVDSGSAANFTIAPAVGHHVADVLVDDVSVGPVTSYNFTNVQAGHTISATFALNTYTIRPSAGAHGAISPATTQTVTYGDDATFDVVAASGYHVSDVLVDGASVGPVTTYTFSDVAGNHTIAALFDANPVGTYTITASAGTGGVIAPSGAQVVTAGANATFTITPNTGFHTQDVLVDGASVGAVGSYTFTTVSGDHTIAASFAANQVGSFTISASAGAGGVIAPSGAQVVTAGADLSLTITPNSGFHTQDVLVDGASVGAVGSYTFHTVAANHTIAATFAADAAVTSITIKSSRPSATSGQTAVLSGLITPLDVIGENIVVYVKKPGRSYFSYSSNRTVYSSGGSAAWLYKYVFKAGMAKGAYQFKACCPLDVKHAASDSTVITVRLR